MVQYLRFEYKGVFISYFDFIRLCMKNYGRGITKYNWENHSLEFKTK